MEGPRPAPNFSGGCLQPPKRDLTASDDIGEHVSGMERGFVLFLVAPLLARKPSRCVGESIRNELRSSSPFLTDVT